MKRSYILQSISVPLISGILVDLRVSNVLMLEWTWMFEQNGVAIRTLSGGLNALLAGFVNYGNVHRDKGFKATDVTLVEKALSIEFGDLSHSGAVRQVRYDV